MIGSGEDFDIVFYSDVDNDEDMERVHYYLDGDSLKMGVTESDVGGSPVYPVGDQEITEIANNVVNDAAAEPIFSYYDNTGAIMTTPANVYSVKSIKISVFVNTNPEKMEDIEINSKVSLRNVDT